MRFIIFTVKIVKHMKKLEWKEVNEFEKIFNNN